MIYLAFKNQHEAQTFECVSELRRPGHHISPTVGWCCYHGCSSCSISFPCDSKLVSEYTTSLNAETLKSKRSGFGASNVNYKLGLYEQFVISLSVTVSFLYNNKSLIGPDTYKMLIILNRTSTVNVHH
jgi:hypothetical protein